MKTEPLFEGHERIIDTTQSHFIEWTFERNTVTGKAVCESGADANCRLVCIEGCEEWSIERDETGAAWHVGHDGERHPMRAETECGFTPWINESELEEAAHEQPTFTIARTPIESVWCGDYAEWSPTAPTQEESA